MPLCRCLIGVLVAMCAAAISVDPARAAVAGECDGQPATIKGTNGADTLKGTARRDVISAGPGNDTVLAAAGNDVICGGAGTDRLSGGPGNDRMFGQGGNDSIDGGGGNDFIDGGVGNDVLGGAGGRDQVVGGAGNDRVNGGIGNDRVDGGAGNDTVNGAQGADSVAGGAGRDQVYGGVGNDSRVDGGAGNDRVHGGPGNDNVTGGAGNDAVTGNVGKDKVNGGDGNDNVAAGGGNDTVTGGNGNDQVFAGPGSDTVTDPEGDDSIVLDEVISTEEVDEQFPEAGGADPGDPFSPETEDTYPGKGPSDPSVEYCFDCLPPGPSNESADDKVDAGPGNDIVFGSPGADQVSGGTGSDTTRGGAGNDTVSGGAGTDLVTGGAGDDALTGDDDSDVVAGGPGNDNVSGGDKRDTADGGPGADTVSGGNGGDDLSGGPDDETDGVDAIDGGASVDTIHAGAADDSVTGGDGDDAIFGGSGNDTLDGGAGYDATYGQAGGTCLNSELRYTCSGEGGASDTALPAAIGAGADAKGCNAYASADGDDGDSGSAEAPFRTVQHLVNSLRAGQVGCLKRTGAFSEGDFEVNVRSSGAPGAPIVIQYEPGAPAVDAPVTGRLLVQQESHDLEFRGLRLNGRNPLASLRGVGAALPSPTVNGDSITFLANDVSNENSATCFIVGSVLGFGRAQGVKLQRNRIHDCGVKPSPLPSSGDHAINLEAADATLIEDNFIFENADRGILLYPDAQGTNINHNVIHTNGRGISFGGEIVPGSGWDPSYAPGTKVYPDNTSVTANVISDSTLNYTDPDHWQVEGYLPWTPPPGPASNQVNANCFAHANASRNIQNPPVAFTHSGNTQVVSAGYADPGADDYRLTGAPGTCSPAAFGVRP